MVHTYTSHYTYTTQAGFCSFCAVHLMIATGIDRENVKKAKLAAGPIFSIIDLVCMWTHCSIYMHKIIQPGFYKY